MRHGIANSVLAAAIVLGPVARPEPAPEQPPADTPADSGEPDSGAAYVAVVVSAALASAALLGAGIWVAVDSGSFGDDAAELRDQLPEDDGTHPCDADGSTCTAIDHKLGRPDTDADTAVFLLAAGGVCAVGTIIAAILAAPSDEAAETAGAVTVAPVVTPYGGGLAAGVRF